MKQSIFIAIHYLEIGGAEISLIGLLQSLDYTKYDVDLFVYSHQGELMGHIPSAVNLLPEISAYANIERPMTAALRKGQLGIVWGRMKARIQHRIYAHRKHPADGAAIFQYIFNAVEHYLPAINPTREYDLAISFLTPHNVVLNKVRAKKKACWIHTDYTKIDVNAELERPIWGGFDHIVSISPDVTRTFLRVFPSLEHKIVEMENILSPSFVAERASEMSPTEVEKEIPRPDGVVNLLSVGRFSYPKNYDNVPAICRIINSRLSTLAPPLQVRWYIIGYGGDEQIIRERIEQEGMRQQVILLGKKTNPYPYIKACDVYVQPSRYEGKSVTVREAQMLCKPVIVTDYPTAKSQIQDGTDGLIVPLDNHACAEKIAEAITNPSLFHQLTDYLRSHDYGNQEEIKKLETLLQ